MPPTTSWADLPGRRVAVWGLGVEGTANLAKLRSLGVDPVLVDDRGAEVGAVPTHPDGLEVLLGCDVVVKTPGISRHGPDVDRLEQAGVEVVGGLGLWLHGLDDATRRRVACITGTKGKSTTTAIAGHLAAGLGVRPFVGGNIGRPPYEPDLDTGEHDVWLIETSSYQATDVAVAPGVVAVTSLGPDHLPWHGGSEGAYYRDKLSICTRPGAEVVVADGTSEALRARADLLGEHVRWVEVTDDGAAAWVERLGVRGRHNAANACLAAAVLDELGVPGADDPEALAEAAAGFPGLESRLEVVATVDGVDFVDDGLSTNVLPTLAAVDAHPDRTVALIVGGHDRGLDYGPLAEGLAARDRELTVVGIPDCGPRIIDAVRAAGAPSLATVEAADLGDAVRIAFERAHPGGVVLLSPAAPSFGRFRDYRERGAAFRAAAAALAGQASSSEPTPGAGTSAGG